MIDWPFIASLEGERLQGYVPDAAGSESGVTIASGVDLGSLSFFTLSTLPRDLVALLAPYTQYHGAAAAAYLAHHPLSITASEAASLNQAVRQRLEVALSRQYLKDAAVPFEQIPDAAQTVISSVAFQYGTPWLRCPRFWACATQRDWPGVINELRNFGDRYPTRRNAEADYLTANLNPTEGT